MKMYILIIAVILLLLLGTGYILTYNNSTSESSVVNLTDEHMYQDALYPIRVKSKCGYMNNRKEIVIKCQYEAAADFTKRLAVVAKR